MYEEFIDILELIIKTDEKDLPKFVNERLAVLDRNAEKVQVLPIKKAYKSFISPTARCFSNPRQKGVFFDDMSIYLKVAQELKSMYTIEDIEAVDWEAQCIRMIDSMVLDVTSYFYGDFSQKHATLPNDAKKNFPELVKNVISKEIRNYNPAKYEQFTANKEVSVKQMKEQEVASGFESAIMTHNLLKFLGFKSEFVFSDDKNFVLMHREDGRTYIIDPSSIEYELGAENSSTEQVYLRTVMDYFPDTETFNQWYYGQSNYKLQPKVMNYLNNIDKREVSSKVFPEINSKALNVSKENIYQF